MSDQDAKMSSPSALRNRDPILEVLRTMLPDQGTVLEIASGSGEHVVHFARHLPALTWQPTDPSSVARASVTARIDAFDQNNILPPLDLDASRDDWPCDKAEAMLAINMVHISPWSATEGLLRGARRLLPQHGALVLYGPYRQKGRPFVESNVAFDESLRSRNPAWGIRQLEDVIALANACDLDLDTVIDMPANNLTIVFRRR